jgi:type II secretory pathway pseudopilin PulG
MRISKGPRLRDIAGFTLIEIMIAALMLLIAMAGIVPLFITGLNQASATRFKSIATNVAREYMEQIRQLDYREITSDALAAKFNGTVTPDTARHATFTVNCSVSDSTVDGGTLKKVTVNVTWTAPPQVSPVSLTTMIHQQYLGPRGSGLYFAPTSYDPLGTPFRLLAPNSTITADYHVAQADWGLVYNNLNLPGMSAKNVYMRLAFFDEQGISVAVGDSANSMKIGTSYLHYSTGLDGNVNDVWFEYTFNSSVLPDGYWEARASMWNEYDQPGNVWRLRIRTETGAPAAVTSLTATPQADNQTVILAWQPGDERDRNHYILQRAKYVSGAWSAWTDLSTNLAPNAAAYTDTGNVASQTDPWGSLTLTNLYRYRIWAVDFCDPALTGATTIADAQIPPATTTTTLVTTTTSSTSTTTTSSTTTTIAATRFSAKIKNTSNKTWTLVVKNSANQTVYNGSVSKNTTLTVSNLVADNYQITASASGRTNQTQSFSLASQAGQIVMTIT